MNPQLRKAAILVTTLDKASAEALLAQMPAAAAKHVLTAAKKLGEVDPAEQQAVLRDFMSKQSGKPAGKELSSRSSTSSEDVELSLSSTAEAAPAAHQTFTNAAPSLEKASNSPKARFSYVTQEWVEPLASLLGREQPQLAALILAHLPPERGATVLAQLAPEARLPIVQRIAEIEETSSEVLDEIEQELKSRLVRERLQVEGSAQGLAALSGILQASDKDLRQQISSAIGARKVAKAMEKPVAAVEPPPEEVKLPDLALETAQVEEPEEDMEPAPAPPQSVIAFTSLKDLDDVSLAAVFGSVSPQVAILALVGADDILVSRILKVLPRKEAVAFRKRLDEVGPLRLKEVELAQSKMSQAASDLVQARRITLPLPQRVRLAA